MPFAIRFYRFFALAALIVSGAVAAAGYTGTHDCHLKPLGTGVPGGVYAFLLEKQVASLDDCNQLIAQVHEAVRSAFDDEVVYLHLSTGCSTVKDRSTAIASFDYEVEAWSYDRVGEANRELEAIEGRGIGPITIGFEPVAKIESLDRASLLKAPNGQEGDTPGDLVPESEAPVYEKQYGTSSFTSLIRWCQAPEPVQEILSETDFAPTADLLREILGETEFTKLAGLLPEASAIEFDYTPVLQLDTGRRIQASFRRTASRDCEQRSCEVSER